MVVDQLPHTIQTKKKRDFHFYTKESVALNNRQVCINTTFH